LTIFSSKYHGDKIGSNVRASMSNWGVLDWNFQISNSFWLT